MFLAFELGDLIRVPFGWLLGFLYDLTSNYGFAMILFALIVQAVLTPINAKSKKSMMKMSRLQPKIQAIQKKYANDQQKQNEAIQQLQREEGASMGMGGCLWAFIPLLILIPLFTVIREPINYILSEGAENTQLIIDTLKELAPEKFSGNQYYHQVTAAGLISTYAAELRAAIPGISEATLEGINFSFFGVDLGAIPQFNIFAESWAWDWAHIGLFLIPIVSAVSQVMQMWISQKGNDSVVTNEQGVQDADFPTKTSPRYKRKSPSTTCSVNLFTDNGSRVGPTTGSTTFPFCAIIFASAQMIQSDQSFSPFSAFNVSCAEFFGTSTTK